MKHRHRNRRFDAARQGIKRRDGMADRLADLVVGLQRMAENAVIKGDDLRYVQHSEILEHVAWLDQQLAVLDKIRATYVEQRRKFVPERERVQQLQNGQTEEQQMPRVV